MIKISKDAAALNKAADEGEIDVWSLPSVGDEQQVDEEKTNAYGKKRTWKYEPPESNDSTEPEPLTVEEIEEIRAAAFEEGFNQGKEEGFATGYEEGKPAGYDEGLKLGQEEGLAQGLAAGKEQVDDNANSFKELTDKLHKPLAEVEKNIEEQLLQLVIQLTEAVTLQEAKTNPDIIMAAISEGIKVLPSQETQTQILLHPQDIKLVEAQFGDGYIQEQGWRLLAAPQFSPGSCQIENSISSIDLQIKSKLKEVLDAFLQEALHQ